MKNFPCAGLIRLVWGVLLLLVIGLFLGSAGASEEGFEFFAKIDNGKYNLYIDTKNISHLPENKIKCNAKTAPSPEREKELRKSFNEANKEAEQEFKALIQNKDLLFNILIRNETKQYMCEIDCINNKFKLFGPFTFEIPISPDSVEGQLLKKMCEDKK